MEINENKLREYLIDYYGSAINIYSQAIMKVQQISTASLDALIYEANKIGLSLDDYMDYKIN